MHVQLVQKGQLLEEILEQQEGSTNIKVNNKQRRDASTSRRLNVAMLQRRDVSASSVFSSLKAKRGGDLEVSGIVRTREWKSEQQ